MKIEELKNKIETNQTIDSLIIFELSEHDFVAKQYISKIAENLSYEIQSCENLNELYADDIFGIELNTYKIFKTDSFECIDKDLLNASNCAVITNKISDSSREIFDDYIVKVPKLEKWQIKDFAYSKLADVEPTFIDWLLDICKYDLYRVSNEIDKIVLFSKAEQHVVINDMIDDGVFGDLSANSIFDFTNAIMKRDKDKLREIYSVIDNIDIEPLGVVTILLKNFMDVIKVQLTPRATAAAINMDSRKFYALSKNNLNIYDRDQLINAYELLTSIDKKIKTGTIPTNLLRDYLITHILSF